VLNCLMVLCAVGSGLIGGVFFAFSTSVMTALGRLPAVHGIAAMQTINRVILNPLFLGTFLGTAIACGAAAGMCLFQAGVPGRGWILGGAAAYVIGSFAVTMLFNVPRNNRLMAADPESLEATTIWREYLAKWTAWNHVRGAAAVIASGLFVLGALQRGN
jgi:uncharacterized membrane protein